jgi:uracil-DNA glycosylase
MPLPIIDPDVNNRLGKRYMGAVQNNFANDAAASILGWWRDAGVDVAVDEKPFGWLEHSAPSKPVFPLTVATPAFVLPDTLDAFTQWLLNGEVPEAGPPQRRLPPAGNPSADLMILADFPDHDDLESGVPISGALAELFNKMLSALGRDRQSVYIATLCPARPLSGRLSPETIAELANIALHHITLVAPKQLWLMGGAASRAILGLDDAAARGKIHFVNLNGANVSVIATAHPRFFEGSKARKAAAWAEMQRLMQEENV